MHQSIMGAYNAVISLIEEALYLEGIIAITEIDVMNKELLLIIKNIDKLHHYVKLDICIRIHTSECRHISCDQCILRDSNRGTRIALRVMYES